ncbi:unnamed protein product [Sphagnum balticum]
MVREMTMAMAMAWSFSSTPVLHHTGANCAATTTPRLLLPQTAAVLQQEDDGNGLQDHRNDNEGRQSQVRSERGVKFVVGDAFYRKESSVGRDLGVLAAAVYKKKHGHLRVLDAMSGCGIRAARYLSQAQADFVWANDACRFLAPTISQNLSLCAATAEEKGISKCWRITSEDVNRVLLYCYMEKDYYDLIDIDSFGSDSIFLGSALSSVLHGGLVYVTSTDGFSAGGHRPYNVLASYGAFVKPMPFANELGIRMLIGGVVREASLRNMHVYPMFSHYSFHGPVFRVMLHVHPGQAQKSQHYNFVSHCSICGETQVVKWNCLGQSTCSCSTFTQGSSTVTLSGPLWTGPLHNGSDIQEMIEMANGWGWIESGKGSGEKSMSKEEVSANQKLRELLDIMLEESDPNLQVGYIELDEISKRTKLATPKRACLITALQEEGYSACRSHIASNAIKTSAPMCCCVEITRTLMQ